MLQIFKYRSVQPKAKRAASEGPLGEASLAHAIKDKTEAAYNRTSMVEQRREVMERWAALADAIANFTT